MDREDHTSIDETFQLLSSPSQRLILQYFNQQTNPVKLGDLAARVARWQRDATEPSVTVVTNTQTALRETYLPQLVEMGLIEYDDDSGTITYNRAAIAASVDNAATVMSFVRPTSDAD